jgi:hypothetical protein
MRTHRVLTSLAVLALAGALTGNAAAQDKPKPKRQPDVISSEEIEVIKGDVGNAEDIIRRLRPKFLQVRPSQSLMGSSSNAGAAASASRTTQAVSIKVYVNNVRRGSTEVLRQLPAVGITEIRYLNSSDATSRFGMDHEAGAILITVGAPPAP